MLTGGGRLSGNGWRYLTVGSVVGLHVEGGGERERLCYYMVLFRVYLTIL